VERTGRKGEGPPTPSVVTDRQAGTYDPEVHTAAKCCLHIVKITIYYKIHEASVDRLTTVLAGL